MNFNAIFPGDDLKAFINQDCMLEKRNATFASYQMFRWVCIMQTRQCKFCKFYKPCSANSTNPAVQIVQTLQCKLYKHCNANCTNTTVQIVQTLHISKMSPWAKYMRESGSTEVHFSLIEKAHMNHHQRQRRHLLQTFIHIF